MHLPVVNLGSSFPRKGLDRSRSSGARRLLSSIIAVAAVWLVVLPWLAGTRPVAARLQWLDEQGIDPSAMYYTELEAMKPILQRLNERERNGTNRFRP
jgi:hypothetical protein